MCSIAGILQTNQTGNALLTLEQLSQSLYHQGSDNHDSLTYTVMNNKNENYCMQAQRLILETDQSGNIKDFPKLPPNKQIEGIFLVLNDLTKPINSKQVPHPDLAGQVQIMANIFDSVPEQEWEMLQ